jgi:hypothetical protein
MSQTKTGSAIEAAISNTLSFACGSVGNMIILPWFGIHPSWPTALKIGAAFTLVFFVKSYVLRRIFDKIQRWNA